MTRERYDAVVVGAGLSGLAAAASLSRAGKRVLLLEHHALPGGYAHSFIRGRFWFEVSLHAVSGLGPDGDMRRALTDLGVYGQLEFERLDPLYHVRYPEHRMTVPASMEGYRGELLRAFPGDREEIDQLFRGLELFAADVQAFRAARVRGETFTQEEMGSRFPHMAGAFMQTWERYLGNQIRNPQLRGLVSVMWTYVGVPSSQVSAALILFLITGYNRDGGYYPVGGSMEISRSLEAEIERHGQDVLYEQTVNHLHVRDGRVSAVSTQQGLTVECDLVVSSMNVPDTVFRLVGVEHFEADYVEQIRSRKPSVSSFILYLGIDRERMPSEWPYHECFLCETYDVEESYQFTREGRFDKTDVSVTRYQPPPGHERVPENHISLMVMSLASADYGDYWGTGGDLTQYRRNSRYRELKRQAEEQLMARLEAVMPGIAEGVVHRNSATPITNIRYTLNPDGCIYGFEQNQHNFVERIPSTTSIPNLLLSGMWIAGGGIGSAVCSGKQAGDAAIAILS